MPFGKTLYYAGALAVSYSIYRLSSFVYLFLRPSSLPRYLYKPDGSPAWAFVTGASDGIGLGFAQELCARGFNVVLHGRNREKLSRVQGSLNKEYPNVSTRTVIADASSFTASTIDDIVSSIQDINLTVLVNNVGGASLLDRDFKTLTDHTAREVEALINVNAVFTTQLSRALLPTLQGNEPSLILNTGSQAQTGFPWLSVYSGTKGYLKTWSNALSLELTADGHQIEVLYIGVGAVQSGGLKVESSFFVPTSRVMAHAALERVGCGRSNVTGYLPHALQRSLLDLLPTLMHDKMIVDVIKPMYEKSTKKW